MHVRTFWNKSGGWNWSCKASNGRVLGDGKGFNRRADLRRSLRKFVKPGLPIIDDRDGRIGTT
jgi:hypothetical protein